MPDSAPARFEPSPPLSKLDGWIDVVPGFAFRSAGFDPNAGLPLVRIRDLGRPTTETRYNGDYDPAYLIDDGDLLIGMDGEFNAVIWRGGKALLNQRVCKVRTADTARLHQGFLLHAIQRPLKHLEAVTGSTTVKHLSVRDIRNMGIPGFSIAEQRGIAGVIDAIDAAIEQTEAVIEATERLRSALLQELLTRGVPGWHSEWKQVPGIGTIPACWEVVRLGEVAPFVGSGVTPRGGREVYATSGVLFIRSQNVHFDGLRLDDVVYIDMATHALMRRSGVQTGDVLLNITGASIGRCTVAPDTIGPANVNQHVCIVRCNHVMNPHFVAEWLGTPRTQREIDNLQAGLSRQGLNYEQVRMITMIKPPRSEQDRVAELLETVRSRVAVERRSLRGRVALKAAAADALLCGQVRVPTIGASR